MAGNDAPDKYDSYHIPATATEEEVPIGGDGFVKCSQYVPLRHYWETWDDWRAKPWHDADEVNPTDIRDGDILEFDLIRGNTVWMIVYPSDPHSGSGTDFSGQMYTAETRDGDLLNPVEAHSDDFSVGAPGIEPDLGVDWVGVKRVKFGEGIEY